MSLHKIDLLDLPQEILFLILKKLNNMDVLYSLLSISNQRLDNLAQDKTFTNILSFTRMSLDDEICSISDVILDRFCVNILPRICSNVKYLILESAPMERILLPVNYPNLTKLKIFNFNKEIFSYYFLDGFLFRHICKERITDLTVISNEIIFKEYTMDVYRTIFTLFKNLNQISILSSFINDHSPLSLCHFSPTVSSSMILTKLCINVNSFADCLALLDGRLKQLSIFIVQVKSIENISSISTNKDDSLNLKSFSLTCYSKTSEYDNLVVPLLRRMIHLEELTLYLCVKNRSTFIDGTRIHNDILINMVQLYKFTFYLSTGNVITDGALYPSTNDIQQTFTNKGYQQVACTIDDIGDFNIICKVFSLPFPFDRFETITNDFPPIIFNYVTYLVLYDRVPFKHEFFVRVAQAFPLLKRLSVHNIRSPLKSSSESHPVNKYSPVVEYRHLISLRFGFVITYYVDQFLDETKTNLPRLTELHVKYRQLESVTENFTRNETRRNCAIVKRLSVGKPIVLSEDVYRYFSSL